MGKYSYVRKEYEMFIYTKFSCHFVSIDFRVSHHKDKKYLHTHTHTYISNLNWPGASILTRCNSLPGAIHGKTDNICFLLPKQEQEYNHWKEHNILPGNVQRGHYELTRQISEAALMVIQKSEVTGNVCETYCKYFNMQMLLLNAVQHVL